MSHIIYCTTCGNAWTDRGNADLGPGEGPCMCSCATPEDERWVAMTAARFAEQSGHAPADSDSEVTRLMAVAAEAYSDGYENGRADAIQATGGTE